MRRVLLAMLACGVAAACSLGLDESLIGKAAPSGVDGSVPDDGSSPPPTEAGTDAGPGGLVTTCAADTDCKSSDPCLVGTCDLTRKTCAYDVCKTAGQTCQIAKCDVQAKTCGAPRTVTYQAAKYPVGAGVGCGGIPTRCLAAVYPFVVVGTPNGVLAWSASDPSEPAPGAVPVVGLTFAPLQILTSGPRIWILGQAFGTGASSRIPLAWIDVPVDPFAKKLEAHSVLATFDRPPGDGFGLAIAPNGGAFLIDTNAASQYATAKLDAPLVEPLALSGLPSPVPPGTSAVAVSGARFLNMRYDGPSAVSSYGFTTGVGAPGAADGGDAPLAVATPSAAPRSFASSATGTVLWAAEPLTVVPNSGMGPAFIKNARAYFLVADGNSPVDGTQVVDYEAYPQQYVNGQAVVGPAALVDPGTAIVTAVPPAAAPPLGQTDVLFVKKMPLGTVKNADMSVRKITITLPPSSLGVAASHGRGYVLASESPTTASVYVMDPDCAP